MANYKIAIIVGSLRKDSLNRKIARSICGLRGDNLDCQTVEIGDLAPIISCASPVWSSTCR